MMTSFVRFKFGCSLEHDVIRFEGAEISVRELKEKIAKANHLERFKREYDLKVTDEQTKVSYNDTDRVSKNRSVLVARVPLDKANCRKNKTESTRPVPKESQETILSLINKSVDVASLDLSEEEKLLRIMTQGNEDLYVCKKSRGPLPKNYVCHICLTPGHFIQDCPKKAKRKDNSESVSKLKLTFGIPESFLIPTDDANDPAAMLTSCGKLVVPKIAARGLEKTISSGISSGKNEQVVQAEIPTEMMCPICHRIQTDPVALPCCKKSACDVCVVVKLVNKCPLCKKHGVSISDVEPNVELREAINNYHNENINNHNNNTSNHSEQNSTSAAHVEMNNAESDSSSEEMEPGEIIWDSSEETSVDDKSTDSETNKKSMPSSGDLDSLTHSVNLIKDERPIIAKIQDKNIGQISNISGMAYSSKVTGVVEPIDTYEPMNKGDSSVKCETMNIHGSMQICNSVDACESTDKCEISNEFDNVDKCETMDSRGSIKIQYPVDTSDSMGDGDSSDKYETMDIYESIQICDSIDTCDSMDNGETSDKCETIDTQESTDLLESIGTCEYVNGCETSDKYEIVDICESIDAYISTEEGDTDNIGEFRVRCETTNACESVDHPENILLEVERPFEGEVTSGQPVAKRIPITWTPPQEEIPSKVVSSTTVNSKRHPTTYKFAGKHRFNRDRPSHATASRSAARGYRGTTVPVAEPRARINRAIEPSRGEDIEGVRLRLNEEIRHRETSRNSPVTFNNPERFVRKRKDLTPSSHVRLPPHFRLPSPPPTKRYRHVEDHPAYEYENVHFSRRRDPRDDQKTHRNSYEKERYFSDEALYNGRNPDEMARESRRWKNYPYETVRFNRREPSFRH